MDTIENFFTSFAVVYLSFFTSTITSYLACWIYRIPFVCPEKQRTLMAQTPSGSFICNNNDSVSSPSSTDANSIEKKEEEIIQKDPTSIYVLLVGNTFCLTYFLETNTVVFADGAACTGLFSYFLSFLRILFYIGWVEGVFYAIHRVMHTAPFYRWIHKKHHENYHVYPADAFHLSTIEATLIVMNQNLPFMILPFTFQEYFLLQYSYFLAEYLTHTGFFFDHHAFHHKYYKWNYCGCFPIFDWIFGTYKE